LLFTRLKRQFKSALRLPVPSFYRPLCRWQNQHHKNQLLANQGWRTDIVRQQRRKQEDDKSWGHAHRDRI